jgi:transcriptional regulator with XRE-family HTH domain
MVMTIDAPSAAAPVLSRAGVPGFSAERLRQARLEASLSQKALGKLVQKDRIYVLNLEGGRKAPSPGALVELARALELEPLWLLKTCAEEASLVQLRVAAGLLQREVAAELRVSTAALSQIEAGRLALTPVRAERLAGLYAVSVRAVRSAHERAVANRAGETGKGLGG